MSMNNNELYHYGVPGMRWGKRKSRLSYEPSRKIKPKLSTGKKVAIGSALTVTALAGVGAMLRTEVAQKRYNAFVLGKAIVDAM